MHTLPNNLLVSQTIHCIMPYAALCCQLAQQSELTYAAGGNCCIRVQALHKYGIGIASGESCHNRVMFKQFLQSNAIQYCQIDSSRLAGPNEILSVYLMAAKFDGQYWYVTD